MSSALLSLCLVTLAPAETPPQPVKAVPSPQQVRKTIEKSIPYLEKEGVAWIESKKCVSCHLVAFMVWGLEEARTHSIAVDEKKLSSWDTWSLNGAAGNGVEGMSQMILARRRLDADAKTQAALKKLGDTIVAQQKPEGFWAAGGQLPAQKRPKSETIEATTMWTVLSLATLEERLKPNEKWVKSREKALAWLKKAKPGVSNEWYALRLLIENRFGDPKQAAEQLKSLRAAQQADGGWGWLRSDPSDALATGLNLYVLTALGIPNTDPAVRHAWKFLIDTQGSNGSWQVKGTKEVFKTKFQPTSIYWGTAWATIGLSKSLGAAQAHARN